VGTVCPEEMRIKPVSTCSVAEDGKNYITDINSDEI
jgi:hypothetical protein